VNWFVPQLSSFFRSAVRAAAVCLMLAVIGCSDAPEQPQPAATVVVAVVPDTLPAPWELSGPGGFLATGTGTDTLAGLVPGVHNLTWGPVTSWVVPDPNPLVLDVAAQRMTIFTGEYREVPPIWDTLVAIPAGTFMMGAPPDEPGSDCDDCNEYPQHVVTLTRSFLMQATEVTNKQYLDLANWALGQGVAWADEASLRTALDGATTLLMDLNGPFSEIQLLGNTLRLRDAGFGMNPDNPAGNMTWYGAAAYCDWLSLKRGIPRAYDHGNWSCNGGDPYGAVGYRLPTEAEWEYACRAGSTTAFANGPITNPYGDFDPVLEEIGWYIGNAGSWAHPVGQLIPNAWGLYDMHGSNLEWIQGYWYTYGPDPVTDPLGGTRPVYFVVRSGAWSRPPYYSRSSFRLAQGAFGMGLMYSGPKQGFRVVRTLP